MYAYYTKTLQRNNKATKSTRTAIPRLNLNIFHYYVQGKAGWFQIMLKNNVEVCLTILKRYALKV